MKIGDIVKLQCNWLGCHGTVGIVKDVDRWSDPLVTVMIPTQPEEYHVGDEMCIGRRVWKKIGHIAA